MTNTPLVKLDNLFLKREDQNLTGSAKDRALLFQIKNLKEKKYTQAVISSTGNAAISAAYFCEKNNIQLTIFLSPKINPQKLSILKKYSSEIIFSPKPISQAFKFAKLKSAFFLRQSTDPHAMLGYQKITDELTKQLPKMTSIFIPIGSGTTLLGISQKLSKNIKIFGAQSVANCPISQVFDKNFTPENRLITDALSTKLLPQKKQIINCIKKSNGFSFSIQNESIISAAHYLETNNIITSLEGALSIAAYQKAIKNHFEVGNFPVILLTGAKR